MLPQYFIIKRHCPFPTANIASWTDAIKVKMYVCSFFFYFKKFLVEYSCFTMLLVSAVQQSESVIHYIYPLFFRFFSHIGHYRVLSRVPCAIQ